MADLEEFLITEDQQIKRFKEFLAIKSISFEGPSGSYQQAAQFLATQLQKIQIKTKIIEIIPNKPVVFGTLEGQDKTLPAILLNGHYDVVPAVVNRWNSDPFSPHEDAEGNIFARGTQDMKSVCMQYIEALALIRKNNVTFNRTIHITFVPDEEIGGSDGLQKFIEQSPDYKELNIGMALDEGLANPTSKYTLFKGERNPIWLYIRAEGPSQHTAYINKEQTTAMSKLLVGINKFLDFRKSQEALLVGREGCEHGIVKKLGDVVTINLTMLRAGTGPEASLITRVSSFTPDVAVAGFDIRLPPDVDTAAFEENFLKEWIKESGLNYHFQTPPLYQNPVTSTDPEVNIYWKSFSEFCKDEGMELEIEVFPASTDSRYLRGVGIPSFGFSPMNNTPILLHDHNEFINRRTYLHGISIYSKLIPVLANTPPKSV